ncbi:MAG: tRNA threonylcarbamoyladenosine dehydratase [Clostridia bacterium]|nr:tRNA threonylcarbamoyladenosine dehydratase [Clostridia bacterium]
MGWLDRTEMLLGEDALNVFRRAHVALFGLGGVGGGVLEALARAGVGQLTLIDGDVIDETNLNRQLISVRGNIGMPKAEAARQRVLAINPECRVDALRLFYSAENADELDFSRFDYAADCIDTVASKLLIIEKAYAAGVPVISCMGTGNKLDPSAFAIDDISKTSVCPLARVMRRELRERGITQVKVLYSRELPVKTGTRRPGSVSFVPPAAGFMIAGEILRGLCGAKPAF